MLSLTLSTHLFRLIEKQQALIALLQEKRQAVISHAVTKGLNPGAELKTLHLKQPSFFSAIVQL